VVSTKPIYKNPWISVVEDKVIRPDGKSGIYTVVTLHNGVSVLPMDEEGNVYLVEQFRYALDKVSIEAVCGGIKDRETPLEAGKRELMEEAGIEAFEWKEVGFVDQLTSAVKSHGYLFVAKKLKFHNPNPDGDEKIKMFKTSFEQAMKWVDEGKITQASTIILLLKASNKY
jgi:8-oxo-dGTP pyrophosphatase MutT (NUDIX family)